MAINNVKSRVKQRGREITIMVDKIGEGSGNVGRGFNKWASFKLVFSYPSLLSHTLSVPSTKITAKLNLQESDIRSCLSNIERLQVGAPPRQLKYNNLGEKLYFNVARTSEQELGLELTHIEHFCNYYLHTRPCGTYRTIGKN